MTVSVRLGARSDHVSGGPRFHPPRNDLQARNTLRSSFLWPKWLRGSRYGALDLQHCVSICLHRCDRGSIGKSFLGGSNFCHCSRFAQLLE